MRSQPEKIGKYEISDVAGHGNMGIVYCAHDPFTNRSVAIKTCTIGPGQSEADSKLYRKMFFNEAHTAGILDHPNIVEVLDAGEDNGEPYIVMEYIRGATTLKTYCASENLLPIDAVAEIGYKCAKALDYAHRRGVVHRDIKPTNIMMTEDGDIKIGDFGIAHRAQSEVTQLIGIVGTPLYMSPEQARGESVTMHSDIYSLGVVLYELLTGKTPYASDALPRLIRKIVNDAPTPLTSLRTELPDTLVAVIDRALHKDALARYQSGMAMAADLASGFEYLKQPTTTTDDEKFAAIRALSFFNDFSDPEVWEVVRASVWATYQSGELILTEGHVQESFYIIVQGDVSVTKESKKLTTLSQGDCFGEMGYLSKTRRTASIVARKDVSLLEINATLMERASLTCQLRFNKVFLRTLIERLTQTSDRLSRAPG